MIPVQLTTNDHVGKTTEAHNKKKVKISKQRLFLNCTAGETPTVVVY